jgi:hypothetical protein
VPRRSGRSASLTGALDDRAIGVVQLLLRIPSAEGVIEARGAPMIEADRRRVDAWFALRGTEGDRIRELEDGLQRLRLAGRLATCSVAAGLPRAIARTIDRRTVPARSGSRAVRPARRDAGAWLAVRSLWSRLIR